MRIVSGIVIRFLKRHWQGTLLYIASVSCISLFWSEPIGIGLSLSVPLLILAQKEIHKEIFGRMGLGE